MKKDVEKISELADAGLDRLFKTVIRRDSGWTKRTGTYLQRVLNSLSKPASPRQGRIYSVSQIVSKPASPNPNLIRGKITGPVYIIDAVHIQPVSVYIVNDDGPALPGQVVEQVGEGELIEAGLFFQFVQRLFQP